MSKLTKRKMEIGEILAEDKNNQSRKMIQASRKSCATSDTQGKCALGKAVLVLKNFLVRINC